MSRYLLLVPMLLLTFVNAQANKNSGKPLAFANVGIERFLNPGSSGDPFSICSGTEVTFMRTGEDLLTFSWDFGDGSPANTTDDFPLHTYTSPGVYTVTLTFTTLAGNETGTVVKTDFVTVTGPGVPNLGPNITACNLVGTNLNSNYVNSGAIYDWYRDGVLIGSVSGTNTTNINANTAGVYRVEINLDGCQTFDEITLVQTPPVVPNWSYRVTQNCGAGITVEFTDESTVCNGISYKAWYDGPSTEIHNGGSFTYTFPTATSYDITFYIADDQLPANEAFDTKTLDLSIYADPNPPIDIPSTFTVNVAEPTTLEADAGGLPGATYSWSPATGLSDPNIPSPVATLTSTTTYTITRTKCGVTTTKTVTVNVVEPINVDFSASPLTACGMLNTTFTDASVSVNGGNINFWEWDFGDGTPFGNTATINHLYTAPGTYTVRLTVGDDLGYFGTRTITNYITVGASGLTVNLGANITNCEATPFTLDAGAVSGANYAWYRDGVLLPSETGQTLSGAIASVPEDYSVVVSAGGCSGSDTVTVQPYFFGFSADFSNDPPVGCSPYNVQFNNTSTVCSGTITAIQWDFGDGTTSTAFDPLHAYAAPGNYNVVMRVTHSGGATLTRAKFVNVSGGGPVINLGPDRTACLFEDITFDAGFHAGATYVWYMDGTVIDFENGQTLNTLAISTSTFRVEVTQGACVGFDEIDVTIVPQVQAFFVAPGPVSGCLPVQVQFTDQSTANCGNTIVAWSWNFGNGTVSTQQNPIATYTAPGDYLVRLTVTSNTGTTNTLGDVVVRINAGPTFTVNLGPDETICSASSTTLDAGNAGSTYLWSTGETTQTITVSTSGTYSVTVTNGGCTATDSKTVTFGSPTVNLGPDRTLCGSGSVTLDAGTFAGGTYLWSNGATTQTITVNTPGTYSVTVNQSGCSASDAVNVSISTLSVNLGADTTLCNGGTLTLNAGSFSGATYLWSTGATTQTITVSSAGNYSVTVTQGSCTANDAINVGTGSLTVNLGPDQTICNGNSITLNAGNAGATYLWSTGATTQTIVVTTSGTYSVTVNRGGCTATDEVSVSITSGFQVTITQVGNRLVATEAATYQWYKNGIIIPGATAREHKPQGYGLYSVRAGSSVGCTASSGEYFFVPVGGGDLMDLRVKVAENPGYGIAKLIFSQLPKAPVEVNVYDRVGRKLISLKAVSTVNSIDLTRYANGQYYIECVLADNKVILPYQKL